MIRGCHSDLSDQKQDCNAAGSACMLCDHSDGCNSQAGRRPAQLSCVQCSDSEGCAWGHRSKASQPCTEPVLYGHDELCYAFHHAGGLTTRGCANELAANECPPDAEHCLFCQGDACNRRNYAEQTCERCDSTTAGQAGCKESETVTEFAETCPMPLTGFVEYADRGCFTLTRDGAVRRGCVSELMADDRVQCGKDADAKSCELCVGQDCNTRAAPSSARSVMALVSLTVCMLVAGWLII